MYNLYSVKIPEVDELFRKADILNFTAVYRIGNPFKTGATVLDDGGFDFKDQQSIRPFELIQEKDSTILKYKMKDDERVFGLGENLGGLNKRGKTYRLYANDDPNHTPDKESLYSSHPFAIIDGKDKSFGFFIDFPGEMLFDIGFSEYDTLEIRVSGRDLDLYIFDTSDKLDIIKQYLMLTGKPYIPPRWAFGFHQCRWSYPDSATVSSVADRFREEGIPCDAIYMDIDYMKDYKVFTVDEEKFPQFGSFVKEMKEKGFRLVPIVDPGVKMQKGYDKFEEGISNNYFCHGKDGNPFVGAVWPGLTCFPDFLRSDVRKWWGESYKTLTDHGIEGFWNDMNEPAIFYSQNSMKKILEDVKNFFSGQKIEDIGWASASLRERMNKMSNSRDDYKSFYQKTDDGKVVCHDDVHNLYGFNMCRAAADAFEDIMPNKRYFLLTRSSYSGAHRFTAIWMGDNMSWWEHMLVHIRMLQSLNMCGFFYTGADVGGFGCNSDSQLVIRWTQLGAFTPLFRNHSALGTRKQEPFSFDARSMEYMKDTIKLRYAFLSYAYSEFIESVENLRPFITSISMNFEGERVKDIEDQYMYGRSLMIAPVYMPNAAGRYVHLPQCRWLGWTAKKWDERNLQVYEPGDYYIDAPIDRIPLFIKENSMIVLNEPMDYTDQKDISTLYVVAFVSKKACFTYILDDGISKDYEDGVSSMLNINISRQDEKYEIAIDLDECDEVAIKVQRVFFEIYDEYNELYKEEIEIK